MVVGGAAAISLGQSRGMVVLGGPVDLAFDVQPDPGAELASSCVTADVAFGDSPVPEGRVRVSPLPELPGRSPAVRLQVVGAVNEPVISVRLSAGCQGKITRTYTFLPDPPLAHVQGRLVSIEQLALAPAITAGEGGTGPSDGRPAAARRRTPVSTPPAEPSVASTPALSRPQAPSPVARTAPPRPPRVVARKTPEREERQAKAPAPPAPVPERSRLVMEPLDVLAEPAGALRPSADMGAVPAQVPASQRQEAAAAWKALNAPPEAALRDEERVRALEGEMAALRAKSTAERTSVVELQKRLELIESQRFSAGLVYALMGLLAVALALLAWVWTRARRDSRVAIQAWRDSVALSAEHAEAHGYASQHLVPHPHDTWAPEDSAPFTADATRSAEALVEAQVPEVVQPVPEAQAPSPAPVAAVASPPEAVAAAQIVNPEELFDIQQQAEFFVSVGEHDQAVDVLKKHIAAHRETSPSAYLELLRLYHTLGRSDDFAQLRAQFCSHFNAQVPEFSAFSRQGRTLEHYVDALAAIEAQWSAASVQGLLEKYLFVRNGRSEAPAFDLAAYDDLLLLLAIAQTTPASLRGAPPPRARTTPLAPPGGDLLAPAAMMPTALAPTTATTSNSTPIPPSREVVTSEKSAAPAPTPAAAELPLDSVSAGLEFDFGQSFAAKPPVMSPPPAPFEAHELDLDLSDPPHLTISDLPPVPVTAPPSAGQPVGFGMANDQVEVRLELEQRKPEPKL